MIITFEITAEDIQQAVFNAHTIGNMLGLPFEVVGMGSDTVQLTIEILPGMIDSGFVEAPFNKEGCVDYKWLCNELEHRRTTLQKRGRTL